MAQRIQGYMPGRVPGDPEPELTDVIDWIENELRNIATAMTNLSYVQLDVSYVAPPRPRNGMIVYADGTRWNPGAGVGFYGYVNGAWQKF